MKKLLQFLTVAALAFAVATPTFAADKPKKKGNAGPRTISGEAVCPKCTLNDEGAECGQAIRTTRKDKAGKEVTRIFYVVGDLAKENHGIFCKGNKKATVTGTMKREGKGKDAKIIVTATKVSEGIVKRKGKGKKKKDA